MKREVLDNNIITSNVEKQSTAESTCETSVSASARKINLGNKEMPELKKSEVSGYRFINLEILGTIFKLLPCKECHECQLMLIEDDSQCMRCTMSLSVWCSSCGCSEVFYTSEKLGHCFEINRRMTYAMRLLGCGLSAMERICSTMNMPPPVNPKAFDYHTKLYYVL